MRCRHLDLLILGVVLTTSAFADDAKDEAVRKDRRQIEGTWRITALTANGDTSGDTSKEEDVRKITVVNGSDGTWSLRSEGKEISKGTSTLDPTEKPKTIDLTVTEGGGMGEKLLGIYELHDNVRKLCFAPAGKKRPVKFSSTPENEHILVTFERVK